MRHPTAALALVAALTLTLAACSPGTPTAAGPSGGASGDPATSVSSDPSASVTPEPEVDDGLLRVSTRFTAEENGAALDADLVLRAVWPASSPEAIAAFAQVAAECRLVGQEADYLAGPVAAIDISAVPVAGTPAWPSTQEVYWMSLDIHVLASGGNYEQALSISKVPKKECNYGSVIPKGPGSATLFVWSSPSHMLTGTTAEDALAMNQYGWGTAFGDAKSASHLSNCVVSVPPSTTARVKAAGHYWVPFSDIPEWTDFESCGVGVNTEQFPPE